MKYLLVLFLLFPMLLNAQRVLQLEKRFSAKTKKLFEGDEIIYQVQGDDIWYEGIIQEIRADAGYIVLPDRLVNVEKISAIKSFKDQRWSRSVSKQLYTFAGGWVVFGLADYFIFDDSPFRITGRLIAIPAASAIVIGYAIRKIFDHKVYKMGKKFRLRLLDLDPVAAPNIRA
ncbi:MAG: hypothetical protein AAGI49_11510 [Bacteroidota bacterium]